MAYLPSSELVATSFIKSLNISTSSNFGVATTFPENLESIKDGFVQVQIVGGSPNIYIPERNPLVQVDCYIPSINSSRPAWGKAATLAEQIVQAIYALDGTTGKILDLGTYQDALVQSAYVAMEPRRIPGDPAGHARFSMDISLSWVTSELIVST